MGRKSGKFKKRESNPSNKSSKDDFFNEDDDMMNDDIDAFHKQRDIIPLDINKDADEESDEDDEHPVYDLEDDDEGEEEDDEDDDDDGLAAKISKQLKYMRAITGGVDDEMHDEADEKEKKGTVWSRHKPVYYNDKNLDSSDDDLPALEEEALRLQKEKAKGLSLEDFGLEDDNEATFEEILTQGKPAAKSGDKEANNETSIAFEKIKKDINALTREEQMDVVYSSAPELVGLLSELNEAHKELANKVNPLLSKINAGSGKKGEMHYLEVKRLVLLSYCQAITFYLLLKSEGQPVFDHPVISRLVEIKALLDKMKELDGNLPSNLEILLSNGGSAEAKESSVAGDGSFQSKCPPDHSPSVVVVDTEVAENNGAAKSVELNSPMECKKNHAKRKFQDDQVGEQSMAMLKTRAALEEKLKQKGVFSSLAVKHERSKKRLRPVNGQLATLEDFDDDAMDIGAVHGMMNGNAGLAPSRKLSQLVAQVNKSKRGNSGISGDDDLPKRDDIGERRRKHELRVLSGAGIKSADDESAGHTSDDEVDEDEANDDADSDLEFYKQEEKKHSAKVAAKKEMYSRSKLVPSLQETTVDGKRQISYQMEKNRGLTRNRNKQGKNPRKKNRMKHADAVKRRRGQVRDIKNFSGTYGGEASGINPRVSRSIRFNN